MTLSVQQKRMHSYRWQMIIKKRQAYNLTCLFLCELVFHTVTGFKRIAK